MNEYTKGYRHGYWEAGDVSNSIWKGSYNMGMKTGIWKRYIGNKLERVVHYGNLLVSSWRMSFFYNTVSYEKNFISIHEEELYE